MSVVINIDVNPTSASGRSELKAIAAALLAMAGEVVISQQPSATGDVLLSALKDQPNFNAVELANDPALMAPKITELGTPDMNPATIGFGQVEEVDPAKLGFGNGTSPELPVVGAVVSGLPATGVPSGTGVPAVPTPAVAPVTPTAPPAQNGSVLVDSRNIPWDARAHAANKSKKADGSWKVKKGVPPEEIARIEGEYQQNTQQAAATTNAMGEYIDLMGKLGNIVKSDANPEGKLTVEQISEILQRDVGVPNTLALMQRPDLVPYAKIAIGKVAGVAL